MKIIINDNEVLIKGDKEDLLELSSYINKVANSSLKKDHIHIDDLTIVNDDSPVKNIIIEKDNTK